MVSAPCYFLDRLPPELRLSVYEYLLVANEPIRGRTRRDFATYGLDLAILRVNRQIHEEANSLFYGKNGFHITSDLAEDHDMSNQVEQRPNRGAFSHNLIPAFDPPLHPDTWPLLRHITIDLLYYNKEPVPLSSAASRWKPEDPGAAAYINALTHLLAKIGPQLLSMRLSAEVSESFCARKCLVSFFICDRDRTFARALSSCGNMKSIPFNFEFPDCYFRIEVEPDVFLTKSILLLACQVMFCQSQVRIDTLLAAFEGGRLKAMPKRERTDLTPYVGPAWPAKKVDPQQ